MVGPGRRPGREHTIGGLPRPRLEGARLPRPSRHAAGLDPAGLRHPARGRTPAATPPPAGASAAPSASGPVPAGIIIHSASARLRMSRSCSSRSALVTISGRFIRRVTISVNGRRARSLTVRAGLGSLTVAVPLRRSGPARQTIRVGVTFRNGAAPRTLTARATRCARTAVGPQFTG